MTRQLVSLRRLVAGTCLAMGPASTDPLYLVGEGQPKLGRDLAKCRDDVAGLRPNLHADMIRASLKMCPHGGGQDRGIAVDDQTVDEVVAALMGHVQGGEASAPHAGGVVRQAEVAAEEVASDLSSCLGIPAR